MFTRVKVNFEKKVTQMEIVAKNDSHPSNQNLKSIDHEFNVSKMKNSFLNLIPA